MQDSSSTEPTTTTEDTNSTLSANDSTELINSDLINHIDVINHEVLSSILTVMDYSYDFPKLDLCVVKLDESTNMLIILYGQDSATKGEANSLKFRSAWGNSKKLSNKAINAFNRKFRFVKAYLDHEGDPILESDILIEGSSQTYIQNTIRKFMELVTTFETFMALAEDFEVSSP